MTSEDRGKFDRDGADTLRQGMTGQQVRLFSIFCAALLIVVAVKFTGNLDASMDVRSADETIYMNMGRTLADHGLISPEYGPLYQLWYFGLSGFVSDPLELYYFNYRVLMVLLPLTFFVLLRSLRVEPGMAFVAGLCILLSGIPYIWPYPAHFAAVVFMSCMLVAARIKRPLNQLVCVTLGFLLTAYVRPEYYVPFLATGALCGGWAGWLAVRDRTALRPSVVPLAALTAIALLMQQILGYPLGSERKTTAFGQHYSVNRVQSTGEDINPWTNWESIFSRDFGEADTIPEAFSTNPDAFLWHVYRNTANSFNEAGVVIAGNATLSNLPDRRDLVFLVTLLGLLIASWMRTLEYSDPEEVSVWLIGVMLGGICMAAIPSAFLIYPRHHYLLLPALAGMASVVWVLTRTAGQSHWRRLMKTEQGSRTERSHASRLIQSTWVWVPVACIVALTLPSRVQSLPGHLHWETDLTIVKTIRFLRSIEIGQKTGLLAAEIGLEHYIETPLTGVYAWDRMPQEELSVFMERKEIGLIVVDINLRNDTRLRNDPDFKALIDEPRRFGFVPRDIPGTNRRLLIRRTLLG